jgi:DNA helicase HerA-like ATPase
MFENSNEKIPVYVDFDNMIGFHFGIFSFTGGGKSNLLSNILRKLLLKTKDTKVVIFDISCEYPFLLLDIFTDPKIKSIIVLESPVRSSDEFYISIVKPRQYEKSEEAKIGLSLVYDRGRVTHYVKPQAMIPTCGDIMAELGALKNDSIDKPHYMNAIEDIYQVMVEFMSNNDLNINSLINEKFVEVLSEIASASMKTYKINEKAGLYAWAISRDTLKKRVRQFETRNHDGDPASDVGLTIDKLKKIIEGMDTNDNYRLTCISISDPYIIKKLATDLCDNLLQGRKKKFKVKPSILFVFDEAQEFVRELSNAKGVEKECSEQIETLLRQGRKYGLGGCIATQRIAYLNTNALQQLHTYFVGTLPRPYDRNLVSNTFTIDQGILEKTLEFAQGEWLLSSYIATGLDNVPIFIKADNSEEEIKSYLTHRLFT